MGTTTVGPEVDLIGETFGGAEGVSKEWGDYPGQRKPMERE